MAIEFSKTALVIIDLQKGILGYKTEPHLADTILSRNLKLADAFRKHNGLVVLVHVNTASDGKDLLHPTTDTPPMPTADRPNNWAEFPEELGPKPGDVVITKKQWGAFYGTDLDLQLRRRHIDTIVLTGIATNIGVESTARAAYEHGYEQFFVADAMAALNIEGHEYPLKHIFPRIGRIRSTEQLLSEIATT